MKKILIFYNPIIEVSERYTRIVDSIIRENSNNKIFIVKCDGGDHLKNCISNYKSDFYKCYICKNKFNKLISIHKKIKILKYSSNVQYKPESFNNHSHLKNLCYKEINIGYGVNSAAISILKDHKYDIQRNKILLNSIIRTSKLTIDFMMDNYKKKFDEVYVFNGRVSHYNSVVKFCIAKKINYNLFEVVADKSKYRFFKNKVFHNTENFYNDLIINWKKEKTDKKYEIGESFFKRNPIKGSSLNLDTLIFSDYQKRGLIPKILKDKKNFITIIGSSRNETESVEGWENKFLSGDDEDIIKQICFYFKDFQFVYRVHPNLKLSNNTQIKNIKKLKEIKNLHVISSNSRISTTELIQKSSKIIVFGSTVGVEANFYGKPVICIGPSWYQKLDIAYKPENLKQLEKLINNNFLESRSKKDSIKYGYYIITRGKKLFDESLTVDLSFKLHESLLVFFFKLFKIVRVFNLNRFKLYIYAIKDPRVRKKIFNFFKT